MGGRTKYIVNGHNAQQQTVQNLFQSVQLNINNPHFLIMQGRITKVLNMKSTEILSMVEEAAGTKMFEDRKNKAFVTMAKKERKVDEIRKVHGKWIHAIHHHHAHYHFRYCERKLHHDWISCDKRNACTWISKRLNQISNA